MYDKDKDLYRQAIAYDLGIDYSDVTDEMRRVAKTKYFGYAYSPQPSWEALPEDHPIRLALGSSYVRLGDTSLTGRLPRRRPLALQDPRNEKKPSGEPIMVGIDYSSIELRIAASARRFGLTIFGSDNDTDE